MKLSIAVIAAAAVMASAWTTNATVTYTLTHPHSNGNTIGSGQGAGNGNWLSLDAGSSYANPFAGRFIMETVPPTGELPANYPIYAVPGGPDGHGTPEMGFFWYCLEPGQSIGVGHTTTYEYSIGSLAGTDGISTSEAALISELFGRYDPLLQNDPTGPYTGGTYRTAAMALQLAIWKINLDAANETLGSWNFTSGLLRVNSANVAYETAGGASAKFDAVALAMLNSLTGTGSMASGLQGLHNDTYQDLLIQAVPEPTTMIAGALLLLPFGASTLRMLRKSRKA